MHPFVDPFIKSLIALFLITDSLGSLPFFVELTNELSISEKRKVFNASLITGLALLLIFLLAGKFILDIFNLTINDLKIAGGILLFLFSIEVLLRGKMALENKEDIGVVPLGCPLLVGPGAITTAMVLLAMYGQLVVISAIIVCFLLIGLILYYGIYIYNILGKNGSLILTKIMSILIAAIAVQFVREGVMSLIR